MGKHTPTIRGLLPTNCLSVFDHFVVLALKGLSIEYWQEQSPKVLFKKGALKNFANFAGKYLSKSLIKKRLWRKCFPLNFANF